MKIGLMKIGARIAWGAKSLSAANGECRILAEVLNNAGADVHIITKILDKDASPGAFTFHNIENSYKKINDMGLDALLVVNGNVNFFGGAEDRPALLNYEIINSFKGQIFYIFTDGDLYLKQVSIKGKEWANKYNEDNLNITRKDIKYISQPYNIESVKTLIAKAGIEIADVIHYPIEQYGMLNEPIAFNENPKYDLIYGGSHRGKKRIKKLAKYYFDHKDKAIHLFGSISLEHFQSMKGVINDSMIAPTFGGSVDFTLFKATLNNSMAHLIIGDPWYEGNIVTLRVYESINSSVVTFIDSSFDPTRRIFGKDERLSEFLYIKDRADLDKKLEMLKIDKEFRRRIVKRQFDAIEFDKDRYGIDFYHVIKNNL
jgi:hypothetical protein